MNSVSNASQSRTYSAKLSFMQDKRLSVTDKRLHLLIKDMNKSHPITCPGDQWIAERLKRDRSGVSRSKSKLIKFGYLKKEKRGSKTHLRAIDLKEKDPEYGIPESILFDDELTNKTLHLYYTNKSFDDNKIFCDETNIKFAQITKSSTRTINRAKSTLMRKGIISQYCVDGKASFTTKDLKTDGLGGVTFLHKRCDIFAHIEDLKKINRSCNKSSSFFSKKQDSTSNQISFKPTLEPPIEVEELKYNVSQDAELRKIFQEKSLWKKYKDVKEIFDECQKFYLDRGKCITNEKFKKWMETAHSMTYKSENTVKSEPHNNNIIPDWKVQKERKRFDGIKPEIAFNNYIQEYNHLKNTLKIGGLPESPMNLQEFLISDYYLSELTQKNHKASIDFTEPHRKHEQAR